MANHYDQCVEGVMEGQLGVGGGYSWVDEGCTVRVRWKVVGVWHMSYI